MEFLKLLFAAKTILISTQPVVIESRFDLELAQPVTAINVNAMLQIELKENLCSEISEMVEVRECVREQFQFDSIKAALFGKDKTIAHLLYKGISLRKEKGKYRVRLQLIGIEKEQLEKEFNKVEILTEKPLGQVELYWTNASQ